MMVLLHKQVCKVKGLTYQANNIMGTQFTEINTDKAVKVRIRAIYRNSLNLHFTFKDNDGEPFDVSNCQFTFTIMNKALTSQMLQITNAQWERPAANQIKKVIPSLELIKNEYRFDFTVIYPDGIIQTLADGEFIVRERYISA